MPLKLARLFVLSVFCLGQAMPVDAASLSCQAVLDVHVPVKGHIWLPGKIRHLNGQYTLTVGLVNVSATKLPPFSTVEVDVVRKKVAVTNGETGARKELEFPRLALMKFSEILSSPESLGGFVLIGDRLKSEAKFVRNGMYGKEPVQEFTFRESDTVFGQILFSPAYGLPLKLDVFDSSTNTRRMMELRGIAR